jgi:hypothetical protein
MSEGYADTPLLALVLGLPNSGPTTERPHVFTRSSYTAGGAVLVAVDEKGGSQIRAAADARRRPAVLTSPPPRVHLHGHLPVLVVGALYGIDLRVDRLRVPPIGCRILGIGVEQTLGK